MMQHWMSWHEVMAQAYILEERFMSKKKKKTRHTKTVEAKRNKSVFSAGLTALSLKKLSKTPVAQPVGGALAPGEHLAVEKDEYPTHLTMRHIFTDRGFVGLSHTATDRVLGITHFHKREVHMMPADGDRKSFSCCSYCLMLSCVTTFSLF
jgi:hypothetical protein